MLSTMSSFIAIYSVGLVGEKFSNKLVGVRDITRIYSIVQSDWTEDRVGESERIGRELR